MKVAVALLLGLVFTIGVCQTKWHHEKLITTQDTLYPNYQVNESGSAIFSPWMPMPGFIGYYPQAYQDKTNLTQTYMPPGSQGFAGAINDSGQVAWRGSRCRWG